MKAQKTIRSLERICVLTSLILCGLLVISSMSLAAGDQLEPKTDVPTPRFGLCVSVVNGKIYAIGGFSSLPIVEEYDPATDTWTRKANMPFGKHWFATCVLDGKIYAIGGSGPVSTVEEYDTAADTWVKKANMPTRRSLLATSAVNGKIYAIGGWLTTFGPWTRLGGIFYTRQNPPIHSKPVFNTCPNPIGSA